MGHRTACCVEDRKGPGRTDLEDDGGTEKPGGWDGETVEGLRHVLGRVVGGVDGLTVIGRMKN